MTDDVFWEGLVSAVPVSAHPDSRGVLTAVTFGAHDFHVARAFTVRAPDGSVRGGHGHLHTRQLLLRVGGEIRVELRHAERSAEVTLGPALPGLLVEPGVWSRQTYLGPDAALVVFCDADYDRTDYFDDPGGPA